MVELHLSTGEIESIIRMIDSANWDSYEYDRDDLELKRKLHTAITLDNLKKIDEGK